MPEIKLDGYEGHFAQIALFRQARNPRGHEHSIVVYAEAELGIEVSYLSLERDGV